MPDNFAYQGESAGTRWVNLLSCNASDFIILLCLTPDDFTCQGEPVLTNGLRSNQNTTLKTFIFFFEK